MDYCEFCGSLETERAVHLEEMDRYHDLFYRDYLRAVEEYKRLELLFREVSWYNFETVCRRWRHPWPASFLETRLVICSARYTLVNRRGGRKAEKATFPVYYSGPVRDAPPLPPEIVLKELQMAHLHVCACRDIVSDPYEWAPGGDKYAELLRESCGAVEYERRRISDARTCDKNGNRPTVGFIASKRGVGLQLGDPMERTAQTETQPPAPYLLGRVCGDRSMVCARTDQ